MGKLSAEIQVFLNQPIATVLPEGFYTQASKEQTETGAVYQTGETRLTETMVKPQFEDAHKNSAVSIREGNKCSFFDDTTGDGKIDTITVQTFANRNGRTFTAGTFENSASFGSYRAVAEDATNRAIATATQVYELQGSQIVDAFSRIEGARGVVISKAEFERLYEA